MTSVPALLALEDGAVFAGAGFGRQATITGEACFNTSMSGYQEVLTDPSYHGQIVAMTVPHIGNTGVNAHDDQSARPWVAGLIVRDASVAYSSWRAEGSLDAYLRRHGVAAIGEVDTRKLTRHIRDRGAMRAALSTLIRAPDELVGVARSSPRYEGRDLVGAVSTRRGYRWTRAGVDDRARRRIAALDFGVKRNSLDLLVAAGCDVTVLPATAPAGELLDGRYDGVFLSNGPGDPEAVGYAVATTRALLGRIPVFGICLGLQVMALAVGARTFKLPFGHRGCNHPVRRIPDGAVEITSQNHGFAVERESLAATPARVTHVNLNDDTVEGLEVPGAAFGVQFHPEAGPGPHDSRYLFERFTALVDDFHAVARPVSA